MSTATVPTRTKMTTEQVAHHLRDYMLKNDWKAAQEELYAKDAVSIEPAATKDFEKETRGLDAILAKGKKFEDMVDSIHGQVVSEPLITGNSFAISLEIDVTMKGADRSTMSEICVYTVKDGKIAAEQFFV